MGALYIHIPFCKQACHYCDFHFSTSLARKPEMLNALEKELELRAEEFRDEVVETIYFGGGTPSLLTAEELERLIGEVYKYYDVAGQPEITLEANPDDLTDMRIRELAVSPVNRLSIGIQSFFDEDLRMMNRAHNGNEALKCLETASEYFDNITADLIYGIPGMSNDRWKENIRKALQFGIPHISAYALTVEAGTALNSFVSSGKVPAPDEIQAGAQFSILSELLGAEGFVHYELSNFGKEGYFSRNNTSYWLGRKYMGIGPSAHSYNGTERSWNVANNPLYIKSVLKGKLSREREVLTVSDRYNEYVMTGLRTIWGVAAGKVRTEFGESYEAYLLEQAGKHLENGLLSFEKGVLRTTTRGKFLTDGIASDLFCV
ncbi:radical SAM family heme chaperone HemW [Sinomicrobium soli]|uniref:radical SAM family heme chaperone HemW n=1 Tax=Sinomicrobium sp. N-1-3-6 TaxID=2219864 RepID=UPI000DCE0253|nr:radical SAM family heme chaperone HemW [Sinomicrobium sp. N-1-3-6]RAV30915.1 coproporphyrinogen III oxidase [Sinomicrobium sp. N-1-3-6]